MGTCNARLYLIMFFLEFFEQGWFVFHAMGQMGSSGKEDFYFERFYPTLQGKRPHVSGYLYNH